jgi:hypothetical protein
MPNRRIIVGAILAVIGLAGAAWVLSIGVAEAAVDADRGALAVSIRGHNSQALSEAAEGAWRVGQNVKAVNLARRALAASPINVQATRTLGQAISTEDPMASARLMLISAQLGWRDPLTQIWIIQRAIAARNPQVAVRRAEGMVRLEEQPALIAMMLRLLAMDPKARSMMVASLAQKPVWRGVFLTHQEKIPAQQLPGLLSILTDLAHTHNPPTADEARPILEALVDTGDVAKGFELHRLLFERNRPVLVSNAGFERTDVGYEVNSSASPFDWILLNVGRSSAAIEGEGRSHVLDVTAAGEIEGRVAQQLVALQPGSYVLSFRVRPDDPTAGQRVKWGLRCAEGAPVLFTQPPAQLAADRWTVKQYGFSIGSECRSQVLELRVDPSLGTAPVDVKFDDIQLRRAG